MLEYKFVPVSPEVSGWNLMGVRRDSVEHREVIVRMAQEGYGAVIADVNMDAANALADKTFVFEAVAEGLEEKQSVYQAVERFADPDAVIASCTSSIDAEILAGLARRPEQLLIAPPLPARSYAAVGGGGAPRKNLRQGRLPNAGTAGISAPPGRTAEPQRSGLSGKPVCPGPVPGGHLPH